jgi:outer membrane protein assembly factor BamA
LAGVTAVAVLAAMAWTPMARAQKVSQPGPPARPIDSLDAPAPGDTGYVAPWRTSYFPGLQAGINEGPLPSFRFRYFQMADFDDRVTVRQRLSASAGFSFLGSWYGEANYVAPLLAKGWRLNAQVSARRDKRFGFAGLGNSAADNPNPSSTLEPFPDRVIRDRYRVRGEVTRRLAGNLHLAVAGEIETTKFTALDGASAFLADFGPSLKQTDASIRPAFVFDSRDVEYDTHDGVLLEAGSQFGTGGGGYNRIYAILRGYYSPLKGTVLAGRMAGSRMNMGTTLNARYELPAWDNTIDVLGGQESNRGLYYGAYAGRSVLFGNAEVRQEVADIRGIAQVMVVGFLDAGRVFERKTFTLTTSNLKVSSGVGVGFKILRSTIFIFNFAKGPNGFRFSASNGWMF